MAKKDLAARVYTLTPEDMAVFVAAREDCNVFTACYVRLEDQPLEEGWQFDHEIANPWQKDFCHASQTDLVVIAGMGAGKTIGSLMAMFYWACMTPDFKGLHVGPSAQQAKWGFEMLHGTLLGTLAYEKFVINAVTKPYPKIEIAFNWPETLDPKTGKRRKPRLHYASIEFMSSHDDASLIKTWEGDWVNHDQAEMIEDLAENAVNLGTRVRGKMKGRHRLGRLSYIANSADNPELWDKFDEAKEYPDTNASWLRSTYDNRNLSAQQIASFERRLGNDKDMIAQHMLGQRPIGKGIEFKAELMACVYDTGLDLLMAEEREKGTPGFEIATKKGADVTLWQMPPDHTRDYVIFGDPGQDNAPKRNAPVVVVLDITDYPGEAAKLRAFWWGDGSGKYEPWQMRMLAWMDLYRVKAAAYDATGGQKLHSETTFGDSLLVQAVDMSGVKKHLYMNALKIMFQRGRVRLPRNIAGLATQFSKYQLPDAKLAQDIVSAFFVFAGLMWALGFDEGLADPEGERLASEAARPWGDRYGRSPAIRDRQQRHHRRTVR